MGRIMGQRIRTGYSVKTLRGRIAELAEEVLEMGRDGRIGELVSLEVARCLMQAHDVAGQTRGRKA